MEEILTHLHQYVPQIQCEKDVTVPVINATVKVTEGRTHGILLGGDQLSQARARSALKSKANSQAPQKKLEGLIPTIEDWHTKLTLFEVNNY